jgi:hypothetical protein
MNSVDRIVARYAYGESVKLGTLREFPSEQLQRDLKEVLRQNRIYFNVLFGSLVGLLILIVTLLSFFIRQPQLAVGLLGVSGVSLPFVIRLLLQMWQAKIQAEALITMSTHLDPATMRSVVKALAQGMTIKAVAAPAHQPSR